MPRSESKKQLTADRRAAGLCIQCGEPAETGKTKCRTHLDAAKKGRNAVSAARKAAGKCPTCGSRKPMPGKIVCAICSGRATNTRKRIYHERKEAGQCTNCGEEADSPPLCSDCRIRMGPTQKQYSSDRYYRLIAEGLCPGCQEPVGRDGVFCVACVKKQSVSNAKHWVRLKAAAFDAYGGSACCGCDEDDFEILEIDHINGGGTAHRRQIGQAEIYRWLRNNNYPEGFRVLCPTCNKKAHRSIPLPNETTK